MQKRPLVALHDGTVAVPLARGKGLAVIDAEDAQLVGAYNWSLRQGDRTDYAVTNVRRADGRWRCLTLHRLLIGTAEEVDHIDGNGLHNRRCNLRRATPTENRRNRKTQRNNTSGFKGVDFVRREGAWRARVAVDQLTICLGYFDNVIDAALAYDRAAREHHGSFALTNFPPWAAGQSSPTSALREEFPREPNAAPLRGKPIARRCAEPGTG